MSDFVLILGLAHEPPVAAIIRELTRKRTAHAVIDQRRLVRGDVKTRWRDCRIEGVIEVDGKRICLDDVSGVYTRISSWAELPEVAAHPALLPKAINMHVAIEEWLETTPALVVNRTSASDTNNSKPYQAMIIKDHFDVPETLVTNLPDAVIEFRKEFGRIIYKSASGERSIVAEFQDDDITRLPLLSSVPVQFQEYVTGVDVRVHVIGDTVLATLVESDAVDYRYDGSTKMTAVVIAPDIAEECIRLTRRLGLELSGIDLRFADDGRIICFEVNPSPAYTVYEDAAGQPIAAAIASHLC